MNRLELIRQYRNRIKEMQKEIDDNEESGDNENTDYIIGRIDVLKGVIEDLKHLN